MIISILLKLLWLIIYSAPLVVLVAAPTGHVGVIWSMLGIFAVSIFIVGNFFSPDEKPLDNR